MASFRPRPSFSTGSARIIDGWNRAAARRAQERSIVESRTQTEPDVRNVRLESLTYKKAGTGAQNGRGKNGGKWRPFEGKSPPFSVLGAGASQHKPLIWPLLCRPTFLTPESRKNVEAPHFSGEDLFRRDAQRPFTPRRYEF